SIRLYAPGDVRLAKEEAPRAAAAESLVRVTDVGICGSDLHWFAEGGIGDARLTRPVVPGHEIAGVVEEGPLAGTPVAVDPAIPCGTCPSCLRGHRNLCPQMDFAGHGMIDGGMRELMAWPTHLLHPLPPALGTTEGAVLEPLGVAIHALDLGHLRPACTVAVVGCGPIGLLLLQAALASGATAALAVDPLAHRRDEAIRRGATLALAPDEAAARSWRDDLGDEVDVTFELAGNDAAVEQAMDVVRPGGRVVLGGIPSDDRTSFPASLARRKGLTLALLRRMKDDVYERGTRLAETGRVDLTSLVTARYPLEQADEAFRVAASRRGLKVVIQPSV
ncbi:MAG TPA: alcohol dehydrogenase catalytic domain-containing protein, partial [Kineosporiaceae bacterium]|nr:alcohol dehydrogenase catalytic domain-containing protein [Kineosporiaceae bacterium]